MAEYLPMSPIRGMKEWSESDFQARIDARIAQLGEPEATLLRRADLTGDEIRKVPKRARRMDTIVGIARALRWTLGQALGLQDPTLFLDRDREIDPAKLALALEIADDVIGDNPEGNRLNVLADIASLVYSVISEREADGLPADVETVRSVLDAVLRRVLPR